MTEVKRNEFVFKYATIQPELFYNRKIDKTSCLIFCLVELLDDPIKHCWANNRYFSHVLGMSITTISTSISLLIQEGYILKMQSEDQNRVLKINPDYKDIHKNLAKTINKNHRDYNDNDEEIDPFKESLRGALSTLKGGLKGGLKDNNKIEDINLKTKETTLKSSLVSDETLQQPDNFLDKLPPSTLQKKEIYQEPITPSKPLIKINRNPIEKNPIATALLRYWNTKGKPLSEHRLDPESKTFQEISKNVEWLITQKDGFTMDEIKSAIDNYHFLLTLPNTKLNCAVRGVCVSFGEFIKFSPLTKEHIEKNNGNSPVKNIKSWFEECLLSKKELETKWSIMISNDYPVITNKLKNLWIEHGGRPLTLLDDENIFRKLAKKAVKYFSEVKDVDFLFDERTDISKMHYIFDALKKVKNENITRMNPVWLLSDSLFNETLPLYWVEAGMKERQEERTKIVPWIDPNEKYNKQREDNIRREALAGFCE